MSIETILIALIVIGLVIMALGFLAQMRNRKK
jgi:LPXTG-motif cell wall-anchored protein